MNIANIGSSTTFESIRRKIPCNGNLLRAYLYDIYSDLSNRINFKEMQGIPFIVFLEYNNYQYFICEKLYNALKKGSYLTRQDFINGMTTLFLGDFEECINFLFNIYDFNKDNKINRYDVKTLLSFLPLKSSDKETQMKSLKEINDVIDDTFPKDVDELTKEQYIEAIQCKNSDSFILMINYLYNHKPFNIKTINAFRYLQKKSTLKLLRNPEKDKDKGKDKEIILPLISKRSTFADREIAKDEFFLHFEENEHDKISSPVPKKSKNLVQAIHNSSRKSSLKLVRRKNQSTKNIFEKQMKSPISSIHSSYIFRGQNSMSIHSSAKKYNDFTPRISSTNISTLKKLSPVVKGSQDKSPSHFVLCDEDDDNVSESVKVEWMYKKDKTGKLGRYFPVLYDNDLLLFSSSAQNQLFKIYTLKGTFISSAEKIIINKVSYYSIAISYSQKQRNFVYFETESIRDFWMNKLKEQIKNLDFSDFYKVSKTLGEGHFGIVQEGENIKTKEKVAVKIFDKSKLKQSDYDLIKREKCVLHFLNHNNIVKLIDFFEDINKIHIVMELLQGGDLCEYIQKIKGHQLSERKCAKIIKQIAEAISYIGNYNLIHRDIKPENIVFKNPNDINSLKVIDFGIVTLATYDGLVKEAMGTTFYIAPEMYTQKPYNNKVDVWAIGILLYLLLSGGVLPFDDPKGDDKIIGKKIVFTQHEYPKEFFGGRSKGSIDLIDRCLEKNPAKRIDIKEFLKDNWIISHC